MRYTFRVRKCSINVKANQLRHTTIHTTNAASLLYDSIVCSEKNYTLLVQLGLGQGLSFFYQNYFDFIDVSVQASGLSEICGSHNFLSGC